MTDLLEVTDLIWNLFINKEQYTVMNMSVNEPVLAYKSYFSNIVPGQGVKWQD